MAQTDQAAILSIKDLRTYYPTEEGVVRAVDGVTFDLHPGKTLGIVGESGCGKSTVGRSILRILDRPGRVVGGEIVLRRTDSDGSSQKINVEKQEPNGRVMRSIRGQDIALIFQEPMTSFSPIHSIGNQLAEAVRMHTDLSKKGAIDRARELLEIVHVPNADQRLKELPFQLSGGLRQRAMIAMALSCNPKILIADEPTTALDVTTQAQILDLLRELQEKNQMAIMLITHNLGVIAEMADDVVVMYLGRAVETGTVDEVFHTPEHPYTQGLLRSIPAIHTKTSGKLPSIVGSIPHPHNRPSGCTFRPRCPSFMSGVCDIHVPTLTQLQLKNTNRNVSCFLHHAPQKGVTVG